MIRAALYGRLGAEPVQRETRNGKVMATASLSVDAGRSGEQATVWISLAAFGAVAEVLLRNRKGDLLGAMGVMSISRFTDRKGMERESWALTIDSIVSARTVRPSRRGRPANGSAGVVQPAPADPAPFDDQIPL